MLTKGTIQLTVVLAVVLAASCGDDDDNKLIGDGGPDAGAKSDGGATGGTHGGSTSGTGGTHGTGGGASADEDGGSTGGTHGDAGAGKHDAGSGGSSGSAALDASTSGTGGSAANSPSGCAGLMACCAHLPDADRMNCEIIASNADDASCDQLQPTLCAPVGSDSGVSTDACMKLNACCGSLPLGQLRVACATSVSAGIALDCQQVAAVFCPSAGNPNPCASLTTCCTGLPPPQQSACTTVVQQGLPAACEMVKTALCP